MTANKDDFGRISAGWLQARPLWRTFRHEFRHEAAAATCEDKGRQSREAATYVRRAPKDYYQAQCSFRGLKTAGGKDELQQLLQHRDVRKDLEIRRELDQLENERRVYEENLEQFRFERWWNDPAPMFEDKLRRHPQRALQEEMQKPDSFLLRDCRIYQGHR